MIHRLCETYPDPHVRAYHADFEKYRLSNAGVERLATGFRWVEGPVWFGDHRCLFFSDIPSDTLYRWDEITGSICCFRTPSNCANGNARDYDGRLLTCEHRTRRVTRTEHTGAITVLADSFMGLPLNSPNDLTIAKDKSIWFSDPTFGIESWYEGLRADSKLASAIYRISRESELKLIAEFNNPNGLCFPPNEDRIYVVDSSSIPTKKIFVHDHDTSRPKRSKDSWDVFFDCAGGKPDGITCDLDGNLWCAWGQGGGLDNGVTILSPTGVLLGQIVLPERCSNLCFGGRFGNRLFMTASTSLYALYLNI